jgi:hypothetical protein
LEKGRKVAGARPRAGAEAGAGAGAGAGGRAVGAGLDVGQLSLIKLCGQTNVLLQV